MKLDEQKNDLLVDMAWDLAFWRLTMVPQMLFLLISALILVGMAVWGVGVAIYFFQNAAGDPGLLKQSVPFFISGSSSLLGLPLFKILPMLGDRCTKFMKGEREFTSFVADVKRAPDDGELGKVVRAYRQLK